MLVVAVFFAAATHTAVWATEPKAAPYDLDDSGDRRRDGDPSWRRLGVVGDFVPLTTVEEENRFGSAGGSSAPGSAAKAAMLAASANVPAWRVGDKLIYNDGTWEQLVAIGSDTLRFVNQDGMVFPRGPDFILPARRFQALAAIFPGLDQFVA
ncbi:MAG TPA: hypothetical protein DEB25_08825, partial [Desulfobulbaceae bacterium]|nr:hypothetical protein [Desulfobulbaceae bacterium]